MKIHSIQWGRKQTVGLLAALALGVFLHDLFDWWPSILTEFIAPVSESIWEHVKIIYWPLLMILPLVYGKEKRIETLAAPVLSSILMLVLAWIYHIHLGGEALAADLLIFAVVIVLGFLMPAAVVLPKTSKSIVLGMTIFWVALILAFTLTPPSGMLFRDASLVDAWVELTC